MVRAYHLVITTYGFWLPNDPRGSWSDFVGSWELLRFGKATKTDTRRSLAGDRHDWQKRLAAKAALKYKPVTFTGEQALAAVNGFAEAAHKHQITVLACAILPEHVHFVLGRHEYQVEWMSKRLKIHATQSVRRAGLHPFEEFADERNQVPTMWAKGRWKVYLNNDDAIRRAIRYVNENPLKEGKKPQRWPFITPFESSV